MKRFLCFVVSGIMTLSIGSVCMAAEKDVIYGNVEKVIIDRPADEIYPVVDEKMVTDGYSRASWGKGILHASNPLGAKPRAYAETQTYSGTAYCMYAQTGMVDDNDISFLTEKQKSYNISSITSATLLSSTEKCKFMGYHGLQDTSSSGWQSCETYKSY